MALPENFSPFEHLQSVINRVQNRIVRKEFSDVGDDAWESDITTSRGSLRVACTLVDNDTATTMLLRLVFYYVVLRKCRDLAPLSMDLSSGGKAAIENTSLKSPYFSKKTITMLILTIPLSRVKLVSD